MTVKEVIDQIERLPREEQEKLFAHYMGVTPLPGAVAPSREVNAKFRKIAAEVFAGNKELFRKLAN